MEVAVGCHPVGHKGWTGGWNEDGRMISATTEGIVGTIVGRRWEADTPKRWLIARKEVDPLCEPLQRRA